MAAMLLLGSAVQVKGRDHCWSPRGSGW